MKAFRQPAFFLVFVLAGLGRIPAQGASSEPRAAVVQAEKGPLFCMEAETRDVRFPAPLPKGSLVLVLAEGPSCQGTGTHFYKVALPGGLEGFVYARYVTVTGPGQGKVNASRVLLRIGPSNQDFPVTPLPKGAELKLLGRKGDWWHVLAPEDTPAWMRVKDLKILGPAHLFAREIAQARKARLEAWKRRIQEEARRAELEKKKEQASRALAEIEKSLAAEGAKDPLQVDLSGIGKALAAFRKAWPAPALEEMGLASRVAALEKEMERIQLLHDTLLAKKKADEVLKKLGKPGKVEVPSERPPFWKDAFVGFLGRLSDPPYLTPYALFKGNKIVCYVRSPRGRYALEDLRGKYLLVKGSITKPPSLEGAPLVDAQRILILN